MDHYIINKNPQYNGDHEVHNATKGCNYLPSIENQVSIGNFVNCQQAVAQAKSNWPNNRINGCYWCANACHTT
ncbi:MULTISPECIES: hypothetical protein [Acinetobacter]|uniref:Uncharacterized protein n=6 Tax=Acinetobacter TaxID=469 RepID=A0A315SPQ6_ACIBA|nr:MULTISPECIES: hypothetical protein [Acinetobacter]AKQ32262.1 hypothetical protein ACX61_18285 [Acinetobacter baumannii]APO57642.1 hypothetical protein BBX32_03240 [Acinetobacter baumannii]ARG30145.1 hypothetical protein B7L41_02460 [Acinetobacter baumannii]ARG39479.1 hypothetical protein B7L35_11800 [Acinetobacter baumannii]ASF49739.1 hypothetical protein AB57_04910 [Acinetobacter baumannii AB0057]